MVVLRWRSCWRVEFWQVVEETLTIKRQTRSMSAFWFLLGMILACSSRLNPSSLPEGRNDADRHSAGGRVAPAVDLLALSGLAASGRRAPVAKHTEA